MFPSGTEEDRTMKRQIWRLVIGAALVAAWSGAAWGDIFYLSGGTTVEGELVQNRGTEFVVKIGSGGTMAIPAAQVEKIEAAPSPQEQYRTKAAAVAQTAAAHVELAKWCATKHLTAESEAEYERALALDGENGAARAALGFVKRDGVWMTRQAAAEAAARASGAPEGLAVRDVNFVARQKDWQKKFEQLDREALAGWFMADEAQAARKEIAAIRDPAAVGPLATVFLGQKDVNKRVMAVEALGAIGGDEAGLDLYKVWLHDDNSAVLAAAKKPLAGMQSPKLAAAMKVALGGSDGQARVQTAILLADAGPAADGAASVLQLINSLITQETRTIRHETMQSQRAWIMDGTQKAYVASLTPVVAEGAVGFTPTIGTLGTGMLLDVKATVEPWNEHVTQTVPHPEVLDSLRRLTGQDFGYDIGAWRTWYWGQQRAPKAATSDGAGPAQ
jgi:hypothetical protein